jgi:copper transport outer membrane protein MctB
MGYSGRYHAASLAAVFLALAVGILIGVGFGSDIVSGTADDLEESLQGDLADARAQVDELEGELADEHDLAAALTPAVVENRLRGREIAIVALGGLDEALTDGIRGALDPSGAKLQEIAVVGEPPDSEAAADAAGQARRGEGRSERLARASRLAGRALVTGGGDFADLRAALFTRYSGEPGDIDGVVVVRDRPANLGEREEEDTDVLEEELIGGIQSAVPDRRVTVVGAEESDTDPSSVGFFTDRGAASVDNVDQLAGKVALVYALGGAEGEFGVKDTADALLPDLLAPSGLGFGGEPNP